MYDRCHPSLTSPAVSDLVVISSAEVEAMRSRIRELEAAVGPCGVAPQIIRDIGFGGVCIKPFGHAGGHQWRRVPVEDARKAVL